MDERRQRRLAALRGFVLADPSDAFSRYALALELAASGEDAAALDHLRELLRRDPGYVPGYQQLAQMQARGGDAQAAREAYLAGIAAARSVGDGHAASEMQAELDALE